MKTLLLISLSLGTLLIGFHYGLKPVSDRIYYGPDRSDCIRIEGCKDGDLVSWTHSDINTVFLCIDNEWIVYEPIESDAIPKDKDYEF